MKIIVAITGASGSIYARQTIQLLLANPLVEQVAVVVSRTAEQVIEYEQQPLPSDPRLVQYHHDDLFAPVASGSAQYHAMVVVPCSMGSLARIATGTSIDLIGRAADVMLKERRALLLVTRESPLSLIHIENMAAVTRAGAIVLPASPSFYAHPKDIEQLCQSITERIANHLGLPKSGYQWCGRK